MTAAWSLGGRLVRRVVTGACLAWLAGVALAATVIAHEMSELMDESLAAAARLSLALYQGAGQIGPVAPGDEVAIRLSDAGRLISDAPWPPLTDDGGQDRGRWRVFRLTDGPVTVEVGQSGAWRREELVESLGWLVALMLPVLVASLVAVRGAVGSALRPATAFANALRRRSAQDLSPVAAPNLPVELTPIPQALNGYLDIIRTRIDAERQFATNAAHELRTPLAAASAQAQLIAAGLADANAADRLAGALGRMGHLVERLLQLARAEAVDPGAGAGRGTCDLVRVVRLVITETGIPVIFDDGEQAHVPVPVDPDALAMILRNLLANAAAHGTGDIRVLLQAGPVLSISNAVGPGAVFRHATFEKSAMSQGAGLGLAIVAQLAGAQGIAVDHVMATGRATVVLRF
ncbi:sensor histidine kinase [Paracoccus sp. Ld10]|uniref:sensor histidine kinase n=1 Tax=Paracoccus sp. Ld10 TaxID=649158 RepID=UPI00386F6CC4